jgi:MSHA pilin protein MshA
MQFPDDMLVSEPFRFSLHQEGFPVQRQSGFTLIELVTVIVILGILAAFAIPRFTGLEVQARTAAVNGATATSVEFEGNQVVNVSDVSGYPTANNAGIGAAVTDTAGYTISSSGNVMTWQLSSADVPANCKVTYDNTNQPPEVAVNIDDC